MQWEFLGRETGRVTGETVGLEGQGHSRACSDSLQSTVYTRLSENASEDTGEQKLQGQEGQSQVASGDGGH